MAKQVADQGSVELPETLVRRGATQPMPAMSASTAASSPKGTVRPRPSYQPTGVKVADQALDMVDNLTNGRAVWLQRLVSYLFIGGIAAVINLLTLSFVLNQIALPVSHTIHYIIAFAIATEVSLMANFVPNDLITFSHLPGHSRNWLTRCLRFHMTGIGGVIVTLVVSGTLHLLLGVNATIAQAIALIIAVFFNFTFHHIFTYRHKPAVL
jgi:putative flippase GtrA